MGMCQMQWMQHLYVGGLPETNYYFFSCMPKLQQYFIIVIEYLTYFNSIHSTL